MVAREKNPPTHYPSFGPFHSHQHFTQGVLSLDAKAPPGDERPDRIPGGGKEWQPRRVQMLVILAKFLAEPPVALPASP